MTPQAFSYPTLYQDKIYIAPYGLTEVVDYMLVMNTKTNSFEKIKLGVNNSKEKWQTGVVVGEKIYFLPYNESSILIVDTKTHKVTYIETVSGKGKWIAPHLYKDKIIALPYGEHEIFDLAIIVDTLTDTVVYKSIKTDINVEKKWHTTQLLGNKIVGAPRGEDVNTYFPYAIEFNCDTHDYSLTDLSSHWVDYDRESMTNKKFTTLAKYNNILYAPPYSENPNFDVMITYNNGWTAQRTNIKETSRKYYAHTVATNGKIFFPPAGHDEDWSQMLIIDGNTGQWHTKDLGIGKESKKYFAGVENSQGKIYYIPRGGCVCEPVESWKRQGDLAEVLVIDIDTEETKTVDISEYFKDSTTIEKYNRCVIKDDIIYAFPYGESNTFQTVLIFDTISETVIDTIDLNEI